MDIILQFGLLVVGFFMLGKGADWFVEGAASIATRFGFWESPPRAPFKTF